MLEIKGLTKVYRPKKGQPVTALDDVSLIFPDRGMVFLLGKSGSGKSTLLNLLGGLDQCDGGEILIKGSSAARFRQRDYDSYRNTYVGFVFQEYNLLDEFTVGANIALALRLQGKRATDERIGEILHQVDLDGMGGRRPSELSGGQKQRVAIARALVKNPEIIMADEPTGALDSATGRQVLETLKRLSKDKLVIVVSHDREFAETYADRIIELADGRVISDMEYEENAEKGISFTGETIQIPPAYHLTEEDRRQINEYIAARDRGIVLTLGRRSGKPTDVCRIRNRSEGPLRLIRSKLPLRHAFFMGSTALKYKKFRLTVTILLSCIAFGLFGLADTFGAYDHVNTCAESILDSNIRYASLTKEVKFSEDMEYYVNGFGLTEEDLRQVKLETGVTLKGVYQSREGTMNFSSHYNNDAEFTQTEFHIYAPYLNGFCELSEKELAGFGFKLTAGRMPEGEKNEIAISEYVCHTFMIGGYRASESYNTFIPIEKPADMVGKTLVLDGVSYTVTGIVDTGMELERYVGLTKASDAQKSTAQELLDYALDRELNYLKNYSLHQSAIVGQGHIRRLIEKQTPLYSGHVGAYNVYGEEGGFITQYYGRLAQIPEEHITWLGEKKESLKENEIIVATDCAENTDYLEGSVKLQGSVYSYYSDLPDESVADVQVVGTIDSEKYPQYHYTMVCADKILEKITYLGEGPYCFAVGNMPEEKGEIKELAEFCYMRKGSVRYPLMNAVTFQLDAVNEALVVLGEVFLYVGLGFALFAALLLSNFISVSISYKKREIGILRAIGSRSHDVFRIFFSEAFIIAMINFTLSATGVGLVTAVVNYIIRAKTGVYLTVLSFGVRQVVLLFAVSCLVAALASFLPVRRIAAKRPIDAIRER